jgi:hypothetical protein
LTQGKRPRAVSRAVTIQGYQSFVEYNYHRKTVLEEKTVLVELGESQLRWQTGWQILSV